MLKKILSEPLLHFLIIGAIVFTFLPDDADEHKRIIITQGKIEQLTALFKKTRQRDPDAQELQALIDDFIHQEIAFDQAEVLGIIDDDSVVKRRVQQKLEYLVESSVDSQEVSEKELQAFMTAHPEKFMQESVYSFSQVYLDPLSHTDVDKVFDEVLRQLDSQGLDTLGDDIMLQAEYEKISSSQVARLFGRVFVDELETLSLDEWHKGIKSGYGLHLVKVSHKSPKKMARLVDIREEVEREYEAKARKRALKRFYDEAMDTYDIEIETAE